MDSKKLIVVVDDDKTLCDLIKEILESEPEYQAMAVYDGRRALDLIRSLNRSMPPNLVLLDVRMPGLNGLQLYDILQSDDATCEIPIIFVTANSDSAAFRSHHIDNYIAKPFETSELLNRVAAALD
ncbi:MAG: two-component system response regulator [Chloroflexia bacterium]